MLGVITARGGSKGIPKKNTKELLGKPLIVWTIEVAQKSKSITDLVVSTDSREIVEVSEKYGVQVPFIRPEHLAQDNTPHLPVMHHALEMMEKLSGCLYDIIVILQPTSPFRQVLDLDATIAKLIDSEADSAVSVTEVEARSHPMKMKKMVSGDLVYPYVVDETEGIRRQDLPVCYRRSGDVYAMTRSCLVEKNSLYGNSTIGHVVDGQRSVDIDEPRDWLIAELIGKELGYG